MAQEGGLRADARANREAIIDAAIELLTTEPGASMQEIADYSGVGRTTLYRHFPSREMLFEALVREAFDQGRLALEEITDRGMSAERTLVETSRKNIELGVKYRFLYANQDLTRSAMQVSMQETDLPMAVYLTAAQERGEVRGDQTVSWMMGTLLALTMSMITEVLAGDEKPEEAGEILGMTLVAAFAPSDGK